MATVNGTSSSDSLNGTSSADTINAGAGNDTVNAGAGNDYVDGGTGNDNIDAGSGNDTVDGGADADRIDGGSGNDLLFGGLGIDNILGGSGTDTIFGGSGADIIGLLNGCRESGSESGGDTIYGDGFDSYASYVLLSGSTTTLALSSTSNDLIYAGSGSDLIFGDHGNNLSGVGFGGNDTIYAGSGNDTVFGEGGDDKIRGEEGDDTLDGGAGNDDLAGGEGKDVVFGGLGDDKISGGDGKDTLHGGSGNDTIGSAGDARRNGDENGKDVIFGDGRESASTMSLAVPGNDTIYSGNGADIIYGDSGQGGSAGGTDLIYGGSGADQIFGEGGNDQLFGEKGNDAISGGEGNDKLIGGLGADTLSGGAGNDKFVFTASLSSHHDDDDDDHDEHEGYDHHGLGNWSDSHASAMDVIVDFQGIKDAGSASNLDKIDLTQLLGATDLKWGGTTPTANGVWYVQSGGNTYVYADINGNPGTPELAVKLLGLHNLTNNDFCGVANANVTINTAGTTASGSATERADLAADENAATHNAAGLIDFTDTDFGSVHTAAAAPQASGYVGILTLGAVNASTTTVGWTFSVSDGQLDKLAAGQTLVQRYDVTISDGAGGTAVQTVTITLTGTNDGPIVAAGNVAGAVTEMVNPVGNLLNSGTIAFTDVDLTDLHSVSAIAPSADALGSLTAGVSTDTTGSGVGGVVTWIYSVAATSVEYLAAGQTKVETFSFNVLDGHGGSVARTVSITITGTNDTPVAVADVNSGLEDAILTGSVATNDSDVDDGAVLSYAQTSAIAGLTLNTDGSYSFDAANPAYQHLADGVSTTVVTNYTVTDELGALSTTTLSITLTGTNDTPVAVADVNSGNEDTTISGSVATNDSDVDDGAVLSYAQTSAISGLTIATDGSYSFDAANAAYQHLALGATQVVVANYTVTDQHGASSTSTLSITLTGTNDTPVAVADVNSGNEDTTISGSVATNDSDVDDGAVLTYSLNAPVAGLTINTDGSYSFDAANAAYQHLALGATQVVVANYTVTDQHGASSASTLSITLTGTNDTPVAVADVNSGLEDTSITGSVAGNDSDVDDGAVLSYAQTSAIAGLTIAADGSYTFDAANAAYQHLALGANQLVVANYTVTDQHGASSASTLSITLTGTNDAPIVAVADVTGAVTELAAPSGNLTDTGTIAFTDVDLNDAHSLSAITASGGALGSLTASVSTDTTGSGLGGVITWNYSVAASSVEYLAAGQTKVETFSFNVLDGQGGSVARTVSVTLTGTNDAPVLNAAAAPALGAVSEDALAPTGAVGTLVSSLIDLNPTAGPLDNATDADTGAVTGIAITATNSGNGNWFYSTNGGGAWTAVGTVTNTSAQLLAADANTRVYFQGNANFSGTVSDGLTFRAWDQTSGTAGTKVTTATNGGTSAFSNATDTASVTVSPVNDDPVLTVDKVFVSTNTLANFSVNALLANDTDIDGASLVITAVGGAANITGLALNTTTGVISFTSANTAGTGSFTYTVSDGNGGTATATVTVDAQAVSNSNAADTVNLSVLGLYHASYIDGRGGADILTGGAAGDSFTGGDGADTLTGSAGDDLLIGNEANDNLSGGAGNDVLRGGTGNGDSMDGGAGTEDLLDFSDGSIALGTVATAFTFVQFAANTALANGTAGLGNNDQYANIEGVIGTSLADFITGSTGNDILRGGAGNDTLNGAGGNDLIDFSDATAAITFTLVQGAGSSFAATGLGTDTYSNFEGVIGTNFADTLTGTAAADQLRGGGGNDVLLSGLAGDDRIAGGIGADTMTGGADNDTFVFDTAPNSVDTITDFDASNNAASGDLIELSKAMFTQLTTLGGSPLSAAEFQVSTGGGGGDTVGPGVRVIYDSSTGNIFYDSDGGSSANRSLFANLTAPVGTVGASDFLVAP